MNADRTILFNAQYEALASGRGLVHLADWSSLTFTGADRQTFLNNFSTNDIKRLVPGKSGEAFFCNAKGRVIGHGLILCEKVQFVFVGPPAQAESLVVHLDHYVIREDLQISNTTAERSWLLVSVPKIVPHPNGPAWPLIGGESAYLECLSPANVQWRIGELVARGWIECDLDVFQTLRIEAGTPLFGVDFDHDSFPQEVGRNAQAISFTKGCYLGQETVARIDALGHVNQQIVGAVFLGSDLPPIGTELTHGGEIVGRVTSSTFSPALGRPLALAMLRREHNAVGTKLESAAGLCEVVALPVTPQPAGN